MSSLPSLCWAFFVQEIASSDLCAILFHPLPVSPIALIVGKIVAKALANVPTGNKYPQGINTHWA